MAYRETDTELAGLVAARDDSTSAYSEFDKLRLMTRLTELSVALLIFVAISGCRIGTQSIDSSDFSWDASELTANDIIARVNRQTLQSVESQSAPESEISLVDRTPPLIEPPVRDIPDETAAAKAELPLRDSPRDENQLLLTAPVTSVPIAELSPPKLSKPVLAKPPADAWKQSPVIKPVSTGAKPTKLPPTSETNDESDETNTLPPPAMGTSPTVETATEAPLTNEMPLDLATALAVAVGDNPQVAFTSARVREAYADQQAAEALWLPSIRVGASFYNHNGVLQNAAGDVFNVDRGTVFTGFGARAAGSGSPTVPGVFSSFALADAIYEPLIAKATRAARIHDASAQVKDVLLSTSLAYLSLLRAYQVDAIASETSKNAADLAKLTTSFADAGQGPQSDADRAKTEWILRQNACEQASEDIAVANALLVQQLSLDGATTLAPLEQVAVPIKLVSEAETLETLLATGFHNRRELASNKQLVHAACTQLKKERAEPFLPKLTFAASYGGFGGGTNGDFGDNFDDRFDFDTFAYWNVRNLGVGERTARDKASARLSQARAEQIRLMDRITREIRTAHVKIGVRRKRIDVSRDSIKSAELAYQRDVKRIRQGEGLPIEALNSLRALDAARRSLLDAIIDHNEAQFELMRAIGWPGGACNAISLTNDQR